MKPCSLAQIPARILPFDSPVESSRCQRGKEEVEHARRHRGPFRPPRRRRVPAPVIPAVATADGRETRRCLLSRRSARTRSGRRNTGPRGRAGAAFAADRRPHRRALNQLSRHVNKFELRLASLTVVLALAISVWSRGPAKIMPCSATQLLKKPTLNPPPTMG